MAMVLVKCPNCGDTKVEKAGSQTELKDTVVVMHYAHEPFFNWNISITHIILM